MTQPDETLAASDPEPTSTSPDKRPRHTSIAVTGVIVLAVAFGIWFATGGTTSPTPVAATSPTTGATSPTAKLANALIPLPSGAKATTASGIGADGSLTLDQFLKSLYPTSTTERGLLQAHGFASAATRSMVTANGQEISIYLVEFGTLGDAHFYSLTHAAPLETDPKYASYTQFSVPGMTDSWGFENAALDSSGNTDSYIYGEVGNVAIIVDCFTPGKLDRTGLLTLVNQQAARLSGYNTFG